MVMSINTNVGSQLALQNLSRSNAQLTMVQDRVSTGLRVTGAKDDSSSYSISQRMNGDIAGYKAVKVALGLGDATVSVGVKAGEAIKDLLIEMKAKIVQATAEGLDTKSRKALDDDVSALMTQIDTIASSAVFNGINLLTDAEGNNPGSLSILSSTDGNNRISIANQAMDTTALGLKGGGGLSDAEVLALVDGFQTSTFIGTAPGDAQDGSQPASALLKLDPVSGHYIFYQDNITGSSLELLGPPFVLFENSTPGNAGGEVVSKSALFDFYGNGGSYEPPGGDEGGISLISATGAESALDSINNAINSISSKLAVLGSAQKQIEVQQNFNQSLIDQLQTGVGTMVDADMAHEAARLQALQSKQQLGVQSLAIANGKPQSILTLFR